MAPTPPIVAHPEAVTPGWLTDVLRFAGAITTDSRVAELDATPIGTGQVGANVRFRLRYDGPAGPASVVCKFASADPDSVAAGIASHTYDTEVGFYRDLAATLDVSRPRCYFADGRADTSDVVLVLEDLSPAQQGDQLNGCSIEQAELAMSEAAKLHGSRWGDDELARFPWLTRTSDLWSVLPMVWDAFVDRYRTTLADHTLKEGARLLRAAPHLAAMQPRVRTVVHGDFRLDNLLFDATGQVRPITVVDWQTVRLGGGAQDVAYFIGNAFADAATRREHEQRLVRRYHDELLGYGVTGYSFDELWDEYRRRAWSSLLMAVFASMTVGRTERGDRMFMAMADRSAQMAIDLDTFAAIGGSHPIA